MAKVTCIIGEPCVGKSLVIRELMRLDTWNYNPVKWTPHHSAQTRNGRSVILGRYDDAGHKYPGTDRLSMAVQQHAFNYIEEVSPWGTNILFEGDRLGNWEFIWALHNMHMRTEVDFKLIHLWLRPEFLAKRRAEQRPDQNAKFWASRKTKIDNIMKKVRKSSIAYKSIEHVNLGDTHNLIAHLRKERI